MKRSVPSPRSSGRHVIAVAMMALVLLAAAGSARSADIPLDQRRSGYADLGRDSKAMQDDDTANPATLWVLDGEVLWNQKASAAGRSCADCHGDATISMKGVAARYPAFSPAHNGADRSRAAHQPVPHRASTGDAVAVRKSRPAWRSPYTSVASRAACRSRKRATSGSSLSSSRGRELFTRRQGQINLSCAQCHDDNWGKRIAGALLPQGHPNGYPIYRLEWQGLGSLQRRLRNCLFGLRAELYAFGSSELVALELFLMQRARGMTIETPAVRP